MANAASPGFDAAPPTGAREKRPRVWTLFVVFVVAVVASAGASAAAVFVGARLQAGAGAETGVRGAISQSAKFALLPEGFLIAGAAGSLGFAAVALAAAALSPTPWRRRLRLARPRAPAGAVLAGAIGTAAALQALAATAGLLGLHGGAGLELLGDALRALTGAQVVLALLVVAGLAGVCEELIFRGIVQSRLEARWSRWPAIAVSAVLFGLVHFDWLHSPMTAIAGVLLGWIASRAASTWASAVAHVVNNAVAVLAAVVAPDPGTTATVALAVAGVVVGAGGLWVFARGTSRTTTLPGS